MNADIYKKIAIEAAVKANANKSFGFVLTSSNPKVDCLTVANGLAAAFESIHMKTAVVDVTDTEKSKLNQAFKQIDESKEFITEDVLTAKSAAEVVNAAVSSYDVTIFISKPLHESEAGMLLTASCANIILTEQKKLSRTDMIENELEIIRNLQAKPIGFILK